MSTVENNDDFEPEIEEEKSSTGKQKLFLFLIAGTLAIGLVLYNLLNDLRLNKHKPEAPKTQETRIEKKKFELPKPKKEPKLDIIEEEKPLPLLPPGAKIPKKEHYKPKIIKSLDTALISFGGASKAAPKSSSNSAGNSFLKYRAMLKSRMENKNIKQQEVPLTNNSSNKEVTPFTGGAYTIAGVHHLDPNLFIPRGTYIGCSLKTRLITMVSGQIACTVSENVYSANGNVLLIEKGSEIIGSYKTGSMNDGMNRHFVIWETIRTPNNIIINVSSPASDELGSAGVPGEVDHHWGVRLGMALMISLIDDSLSYASQRLSNKQGSYNPEKTQESAQGVTNNLINKFSNIKPTLYKNQGDIVAVFVNKDIDFSRVYSLRRRR